MRAWRPPAPESPAAAGDFGKFWHCGIAASHERWPPGEYSFRLPPVALPLFAGHEEHRVVTSGEPEAADVGACRLFAEVEDLGVIVLAEVFADYSSVLCDIAEGRQSGLSIGYCTDESPGGGPELIYIKEVSLTSHPADPLARVVSTGQLALSDWETLTGEPAPAGLAGR